MWQSRKWLAVLAAGAVLAAAAACSSEEQTSAPLAAATTTARQNRAAAPQATGTATATSSAFAATLEVAPDSASSSAPNKKQGSTNSGGVDTASQLFDRKIIQDASIQLKVKDVGVAFNSVGRIASTEGGFVTESSFYTERDYRVGTITIRVPGDRFQGVLQQVRDLGLEVINENSSARDVTEEYTDLSSRLRNLRATEDQYLKLLAQATTINDILVVQDRLNGVRAEIEQIQGRINVLDHLSELATLKVELKPEAAFAKAESPKTEPGDGFGETVTNAWERSVDIVVDIATGLAAALVFSWWLAIPALVVVLVLRRLWTGRPSNTAVVVDTGRGRS